MKTQSVRLVDVFALGPFMIYAAYKGKLSTAERVALGFAGLATIAYNWKNYLEEKPPAALPAVTPAPSLEYTP